MNGMEWFLAIVVLIIAVGVVFANFYILVHFSHPEDNFTTGIWLFRALVIGVLSFAAYLIFAIPLDIACAPRSDSMKLPYDMDFIWTAINFAICFVLMFFLPMALALYNDESEDWQQTVKQAIKISSIIALGHIAFVILYWLIVSTAQIPVRHVVKRMIDVIPSDTKVEKQTAIDFYLPTTADSGYVSIKLGFFNCCTLHLTVIGSILLVLLGGYGLALFPMEFLNNFLNRPQIRDPEDFVLTKIILRLENEKLVNHAKKVKQDKEDLEKRTVGFIAQRARKMALQKEINELKSEFLEFEEVMECFKQEQNIQEVNPLVHISYLVFGCIGYLASFLIIFHT